MSHKPILDPDHPEYSNDDPTWGEERRERDMRGYIVSVRGIIGRPEIIVTSRCPFCFDRTEVTIDREWLAIIWTHGRLCSLCFAKQERVRG